MSDETLVTCPGCNTPNFTPRGLRAHRCKGAKPTPRTDGLLTPYVPINAGRGTAKSVAVEVVTASHDLATLAEQAAKHRETIQQHASAFEHSALGESLCIGLVCKKAHLIFGLSAAERAAMGGKARALSPRDKAETPASFDEWLERDLPWLKRPTAYKYMRGLDGLGLDHKATAEQVRFTLDTARDANAAAKLPAPSLAGLVKEAKRLAGPEEDEEQSPGPADGEATRLGDAREAVEALRADWSKFVKLGHLDNLPKDEVAVLKELMLGWRDQVNSRLK